MDLRSLPMLTNGDAVHQHAYEARDDPEKAGAGLCCSLKRYNHRLFARANRYTADLMAFTGIDQSIVIDSDV